MTHTLIDAHNKDEISIRAEETFFCIKVKESASGAEAKIYLERSELHDFIGTLLHVQNKKKFV